MDNNTDDKTNDMDALDKYQDIIQEVLAGRVDGQHCPYCETGVLKINFDGSKMMIKCPECGRFFEGMLA